MDTGRAVPPSGPSEPTWNQVVVDLVLVAAATVLLVGVVLAYGEQGGPAALRLPLGVAFVVFLPGYAITAALFPRSTPSHAEGGRRVGVTLYERLILSVGLSITVVPLLGLTLTLLSLTVGLVSVIGSIALLTLASTAVAGLRRWQQQPHECFYVPFGAGVRYAYGYTTASGVNLVIVLLLVAVAAGGGLALINNENSERYTEFAILAADGGNGTATYPTELPADGSETLRVEIANEEHREIEYTAVVLLQERTETGEIIQSSQLDRFSVELAHGERTVYEHQPQPTIDGEGLRLTYLLYRGEPPAEPTRANAYRAVYLTVDA